MSVFYLKRGPAAAAFEENFADNTWEQIAATCQANKVPDSWKVGDTKPVTSGGVTYNIVIIGKNHDVYADGSGTAPLTFQLNECLPTTVRMHNSNSNAVGWENSEMRKTGLLNALGLYPEILDIVMHARAVQKKTSAGGNSSTIVTTEEYEFLLSEVEVLGTTSQTYAGEGSRYEYYANGGSAIKTVNGTAANWWLRSPRKSDTQRFAMVRNSGKIYYGLASTAAGVSFAFCF